MFGATEHYRDGPLLSEIRRAYPEARLFGCSTAGEICGTEVTDHSMVVTAVHFERTFVRGAQVPLEGPEDSFSAGQRLAALLDPENLTHVLVLSEGLRVNGSALIEGLSSGLPEGVAVTGGLSGDGDRFQQTFVCLDGSASQGAVAVIGLYGKALSVAYASMGGWDPFGPEREITRSRGHVLYELDGQSALALYKRYLGEHAAGLPASGLLFPLSLRVANGGTGVVRTIHGIDEAEQSLSFAGDLPMGAYARLMKANFERLIEGAHGAAKAALSEGGADLALLISCVGRKLVLKQRIEEEVESVREVLGPRTTLTGFYSYGEISPFTPSGRCELHNQTMTITTFTER